MEVLAIIVVLVAGFGFLAIRRHYLDARDSADTAAAGDGWRVRSELPHDAGPPYSDFGTDLFLRMPSEILEGSDEGFAVAYFTIEDGRRSSPRVRRDAAIVQVPCETPKFRYAAGERDTDVARATAALQQPTPPHEAGGRLGRIGPQTAEVLALAPLVIVQTAPFAVFVRSIGARREDVQRVALRLARALVADARAADAASADAVTGLPRPVP